MAAREVEVRMGEGGGLVCTESVDGRTTERSAGRVECFGKARVLGVCVGRSYCESGKRE